MNPAVSTANAVAAADRADSAANRVETAERRQRRASAAQRGVAPTMPGVPKVPVRLPSTYWGERTQKAVGEFLELLPIIELVAGLSVEPTVAERAQMQESQVDAMMNARLTALLSARKIVVERVRKEI